MHALFSSQTADNATSNAVASPGWIALGVISVGFHLGLIFYGLTPALVSRPLHMALLLPWVLIYMAKTPFQRISGWGLTLLGIAACAYIALNEATLANQYGFIDTHLQMAIGLFLIMLALEAARRAIGWPLPLVALLALLYGAFG
ncbi:MAG: TRAP transporter permease DctM/Q, partial [Vreelandella alkaliphila]